MGGNGPPPYGTSGRCCPEPPFFMHEIPSGRIGGWGRRVHLGCAVAAPHAERRNVRVVAGSARRRRSPRQPLVVWRGRPGRAEAWSTQRLPPSAALPWRREALSHRRRPSGRRTPPAVVLRPIATRATRWASSRPTTPQSRQTPPRWLVADAGRQHTRPAGNPPRRTAPTSEAPPKPTRQRLSWAGSTRRRRQGGAVAGRVDPDSHNQPADRRPPAAVSPSAPGARRRPGLRPRARRRPRPRAPSAGGCAR